MLSFGVDLPWTSRVTCFCTFALMFQAINSQIATPVCYNSFSIHRYLLVSLVIARKYLEDKQFNQAHYAFVVLIEIK